MNTHSSKKSENQGRSAAGKHLRQAAADEMHAAPVSEFAPREQAHNTPPPVQKKANPTGMPDNLKAGLENLSGHSMDDVRVHYNSSKPAQLQAHAYAQGTDIHLAPGQQQHLPHEAWHVVQQKQGRVKPTLQLKQMPGVAINDDAGLEKESDIMGQKALQMQAYNNEKPSFARHAATNGSTTVQRKVIVDDNGRPAPATLVDPHTAMVNKTPVSLNAQKAKWVTDGFSRFYKNVPEFEMHAAGLPVDVGLAPKLGVWYRLPEFSQGQFFVLGENHGMFGYRELIKESNQTGKVLGEGGTNKLLSASFTSPLQEAGAKGLTNPETGEKQEFVMETIASKAYFSFAYLVSQKGKVPAKPKADVEKIPQEEWLRNYQSQPQEKRKRVPGFTNPLPYYEDNGKKYFATTGSKAEEYNTTDTALSIIETLKRQLDEYEGPENAKVTTAKEAITTYMADKENEESEEALLNALRGLSGEETKPLYGAPIGKPAKYLNPEVTKRMDQAAKNIPAYSKEAKEKLDPETRAGKAKLKNIEHQTMAFAFRDLAMFQSVLKAQKQGFIMAGMGNNHAKNLSGDLKDAGIKVILFEEFMAPPYTSDAIAPQNELEGYSDGEWNAERDKEKLVKSMEEATPALLMQMYQVLGKLYVYPQRKGLSVQAPEGSLVIRNSSDGHPYSMGLMFERFISLYIMAGKPKMSFFGTLNSCLVQLWNAYESQPTPLNHSQALSEFKWLNEVLESTGLAQIKLQNLLMYLTKNQKKETGTEIEGETEKGTVAKR